MKEPVPEESDARSEKGSTHYLKGLGKRLRSAREAAKLTAGEAGKRAHVSESAILRYERGEAGPGPQKMLALADAYGVCCNWLLGRLDWSSDPEAGKAVADLDKIDAVENAKTEEDIESLIMWRPPPIFAVVSVPQRRRIVSVEEAVGIGSLIFDRIRTLAPKTYMRWAAKHI